MNAGRVAWGVAALLLAGAFAALGAWQWQRATQKAGLLARWQAALVAPPLALAAALEPGRTLPARAEGAGRFVADATVLLDNQVREGRAGVMVLSLFQPDGAHRALLVNRGWIALDAQRRLATPLSAVDGAVQVSGLLAPPPSAGLRVDNAPWRAGAEPPLLNWLDLPALARQFGRELHPGVLLLDESAPFGYARAWQPLPNTLPPARHRGYAVQWFGLALTVLVVSGVMIGRRTA